MTTAACGQSEASPGADSGLVRPSFVEPQRFDGVSSLPFAAFSLGDEESRRFQELQVGYLRSCLGARAGDVELFGDYTDGDLPGAQPKMWFGLPGTMPRAHAAEFGYKPGPDNPGALGPPIYLKSLILRVGEATPAGHQTLFGVEPGVDGPIDSGGCMKQLSEAMKGLPDDESMLDLQRDLTLRALSDSRVQDAQARWSGCMRRSGYDYDAPLAAPADFALGTLTAAEAEVAVADVDCTAESQWADVYLTILTDYQNQVIEREPERFSSSLAAARAMLTRLEASPRS